MPRPNPISQTSVTPANNSPQSTGTVVRPKVLVLLAAFNGAAWIREQIESILAQEGVDVRIVVRDDGSTDATRLELGRLLAEDARITMAPSSNPTGSAAQNFLALIRENAVDEFDFIAFADQDDLWNRNKLYRASCTLRAERTDGYSSTTTASWADGRQLVLRQVGTPTRSDFLFEGAGQGCTFVLSAGLYTRFRQLVVQYAQLTRHLHYHDWSVYAVARAWGLTWSFDPKPCMTYRQHDANDTGARGTKSGIAKRLRLIKQGWYRTQLCAIAELCSVAAPANGIVTAWRSMLLKAPDWRRKLRIARFCLQGGRRRSRDNTIVILAALAGWI